jgi:hypothetical protein
MEALSSREWLQRHCTMTDEDLTKSATRNRLNILLSRARHVSYHMGQVALARSQQRGQTSRSETKNYA